MANHAYLIKKRMPPLQQVVIDMLDIQSSRFPNFSLTHDGSGYISLGHPFDYNLEVHLWYQTSNYIDTKEPSRPCLNFRHGHSYDCLWWIEETILLELCERYKIKRIYDEGIGWFPADISHRCVTYADYLKRHYLTAEGQLSEYRVQTFKEELKQVPKDMKRLFGKL